VGIVWWTIGAILAGGYFVYVFHSFRGKVDARETENMATDGKRRDTFPGLKNHQAKSVYYRPSGDRVTDAIPLSLSRHGFRMAHCEVPEDPTLDNYKPFPSAGCLPATLSYATGKGG
jgi:hypothetical protein